VLRQALAESLLLASASGITGVMLSLVLVAITRRLAPADIPGLAAISVNVRVLLFAVTVVALTTMVCAMAPAIQASGTDVLRHLRQGGRGVTAERAWLRRLLAASEVALPVTLLVAAGVVGRTFLKLRSVDVGFTADRILAFDVPLPATRYPKPEHNQRFNDRLLPRLSALPGVRRAAAVLLRPLWSTVGMDWPVVIDGQAPADALR
jgi:putative ABC transport system permease protein